MIGAWRAHLVLLNLAISAVLVSLAIVELLGPGEGKGEIAVPLRYQPAAVSPGAGTGWDAAPDAPGTLTQGSGEEQPSDRDLHPLHAAARLAYEHGKVDEALSLASDLVAERHDDAVLHNDLGVYLRAAERPDEAEIAFRRAVELAPAYARAWYNLGTLLLADARAADAHAALTTALEHHPFDSGAWYNLGLACSRLDRDQDAIAAYRRSTELNTAGSSAPALYNLGVVLIRTGERREAIEVFDRALYLRPDHVSARYNRARCFSDLGLDDAAAADYRKLLDIEPQHQAAAINLAAIHMRREDYVGAIDLLVEAVAADDPSPNAWYNLGLCYLKTERHGQAVHALTQSAELQPEHAPSWHNLGLAQRRSGDDVAGLAAHARACELDPGAAHYHLSRALALEETGHRDPALLAYRRCRELDPGEHLAWSNAGRLTAEAGDYALGAELLRQACVLRPQAASDRYLLGRCLLELDQAHAAIAEFERALEYGEEQPEYAHFLGRAREAIGDRAAAIAAYRRALAVEPRHVASLRRCAPLLARAGEVAASEQQCRRLRALTTSDDTPLRVADMLADSHPEVARRLRILVGAEP